MDSTLLAFGLGPAEIGLLFIVMVFVFGPKRLPELGKSMGEALTSFKSATNEAKAELDLSEATEPPAGS